MTTSDIFKNQRPVWKEYQTLFVLARRALPFIIGVAIGGIIFSTDPGYTTNLYTEILSIAATVGILDYLNDQRRKQEQVEDLKQRLIRDAGSTVNDVAIKAIEDLRTYEWLTGDDGLLKEADLRLANLANTNLEKANLTKANLRRAILTGTDLPHANLEGTHLEYAKLQEAILSGANMEKAILFGANMSDAEVVDVILKKADLRRANLTGTYLWNSSLEKANLMFANLERAYLEGTNLENVRWTDENGDNPATLPDGTQWTPDTDMERFTNKNHPDFWQPSENKDNE